MKLIEFIKIPGILELLFWGILLSILLVIGVIL
jgi:hypothetical protein